ncbi:hypothetical protein [Diaphorobacter aerolatus]|uniref:Uncharacterized protein n=1 Tax=Diaphorobacter aerolatus TaxID=1288495 RepID=A0A7H0GHL1_9BURK|nr:hypothetical protein [Diaphorobacter aerolatus]QNP47777.1 hypothetical protein H9K75_16610 [Diaphorobacter aerolatus]
MPNLLFAPAHIPLVIAGLLASSSLMAAPVAPLPLFSENFDNTAAPNASGPLKPLLLDQYVSAATDFAGAALGETYGAVASEKYLTIDTRPYWINPGYCNGIWVSYDMANPNAGAAAGSPLICNARQLSPVNPAGLGNSIAAWQNLQVLANVLGQVTNPTPNTRPSDNTGNHIIAAYTEAYDNLAAREFTILKTNKNIPIPPGGRFLTFSVAAAAVNCSATTPLKRIPSRSTCSNSSNRTRPSCR